MARLRTWHALLVGIVSAAVIAPPASASEDPPETSAPTRAPGDVITPLLFETGRPADLSVRGAVFSFYVGAAASVTHRVTYRGHVLGERTVVCPQGRTWRVRIDFGAAAQRRMRRLLAAQGDEGLVWEMTLTDGRGNVAHRTVDVPV